MGSDGGGGGGGGGGGSCGSVDTAEVGVRQKDGCEAGEALVDISLMLIGER